MADLTRKELDQVRRTILNGWRLPNGLSVAIEVDCLEKLLDMAERCSAAELQALELAIEALPAEMRPEKESP